MLQCTIAHKSDPPTTQSRVYTRLALHYASPLNLTKPSHAPERHTAAAWGVTQHRPLLYSTASAQLKWLTTQHICPGRDSPCKAFARDDLSSTFRVTCCAPADRSRQSEKWQCACVKAKAPDPSLAMEASGSMTETSPVSFELRRCWVSAELETAVCDIGAAASAIGAVDGDARN